MGPLKGLRILELRGIGPGPFCGMMLADLGAEVIAVSRVDGSDIIPRAHDIMMRGKKAIAIDLKSADGVETFLRLADTADAVFDGFRPGVVGRLGVGPEACQARNGKLVYGHMTGWGQDGPLAGAAGHDINYIALSGALYGMGRDADAPPPPPLNLVGDYGGGGMLLALGLVSAILEAKASGQGQVVDVSMVEGSSLLMTAFHSLMAAGLWGRDRAANFLDSGAPFYDSYETGDGGYVSIGCLEPQFYAILVEKLDLKGDLFAVQHDRANWPEMKAEIARVFKTRSRDEWCALFEGTDACFAPVLPIWEAPLHPHNVARGSFIEVDGLSQPAPAPRFSRTPAEVRHGPPDAGADCRNILNDAGFSTDEIETLIDAGTIG